MERIQKNLQVLLHTYPEVRTKCIHILKTDDEALRLSAVFDAINSADSNEKRAGIFLIVCLVDLGIDETAKASRFVRNLLKILVTSTESVAKLASRAIVYLILTSKSCAVELMEVAFNQCFEWLEEEQSNEHRRLASLILARDLALFTQSHFFQRVSSFFNHIFKVVRDSRLHLRIASAEALQAALAVTSQREAKHKKDWYNKCFKEACFYEVEGIPKDDLLHSSLLIFNELLRITNYEYEKIWLSLSDVTPFGRANSIIGQNPIKWLIEPINPPAVESTTSKTLVTDCFFAQISKRCMEARASKSQQCQVVLLEILPRLVSFMDTYGNKPMTQREVQSAADHAIAVIGKYPQALTTLGLIALSRPNEMRNKVAQVLQLIVQHLHSAISKKKQVAFLDFQCLSLLIRSQRSYLSEKILNLLPLLFSTGISEGLIQVLHVAIEMVPELKSDIYDGLMDQLYQLLMDRPRPGKLSPPTAPPVPSGPIQPKIIAQTRLALKALGEFNFSRHSLQMFLRYVALGYLASDSVEIRLISVYSCTEMLKPFVKIFENVGDEQKAEVYLLVKNVLECLVRTAIVDPEPNVRLNVLVSFCRMDRDFLFHLAQREILETLFMTMQDENYQVQEQAAELLGKLSEINPAFVFLKFRRVVLESISQLVNSRLSHLEEHSARMIARLAKQSPKFMAPYMNSALVALVSHLKLERNNVEVTVDVLNALSEISLIGGLEIARNIGKLFPPLIAYLQDSTSLNRREAALRAMGGICQSTGYVVEPYRDYPELLDALLRLLKTELSSSMRRLTMKVLGIIGALDPYTHKVYTGKVHSHSKSRSLALTLPNSGDITDHYGTDIIQWINYERCTLVEYYPTLAISNLVQMLSEPQRVIFFHKEIVNALLQIFSGLGPKSSQYVNQVVPPLIRIMEKCRPELREFFLGQFTRFASIVRLQLHPFMTQIFGFISKAWHWNDNSTLRGIVIMLIEELGSAFGTKFAPYVTDLCPYLLSVVRNDDTPDKKLTTQALSCVRTIAICLGTHIHLILAPILTVVDDRRHTPEKTRILAIESVIELATQHPISDRAPAIMQIWLRCISNKALQPKLMELLLIIMQKWDQFSMYKESVNDALQRNRLDSVFCKEYQAQLSLMQTGSFGGSGNLMRELSTISPMFTRQISFLPKQEGTDSPELVEQDAEIAPSASEKSLIRNVPSGRDIKMSINLDQLRRFWTVQPMISREDWLQWLGTLRTQFIRQSSSSAIRACAVLAEMYEPLSKDLFNAAFMSIWTEIREQEQNELTSQLIEVLQNCPHAEPIQAILNLAEFMDHSEKGPLHVSYKMLSEAAEKTRAYAKALRYRELEIVNERGGQPNSEDCQSLILLFNKLNLEEGAAGVVQHAKRHSMEISGRWYEKLGEWEKALEMYQQDILSLPEEASFGTLSSASSLNQQQPPHSATTQSATPTRLDDNSALANSGRQQQQTPLTRSDLMLHQMRCLEALGQWSQLSSVCQTALMENEVDLHNLHQHHPSGSGAHLGQHRQIAEKFGVAGEFLNATLGEVAKRQKIAQMAARGSWAVGNYERLGDYVAEINENSQEGSFLRAVLAIHNADFERAYSYINKVRDIFDSELTAMATESYERAYGAMVLLQELTELEEAIEYKMIPEREIRIALLWSRRLQGCRRNIEHWRRILMVRSIVFTRNELHPLWIKFAALCRHEGKHLIARNVLRSLLEIPPETALDKVSIPMDRPQLALVVCKQLWTDGQKRPAFAQLEQLTQALHRLIERNRSIYPREQLEPMARITAKCYLKLGEWHESISSTHAPMVNVPAATSGRHGSVSIHSGRSAVSLVPGASTSGGAPQQPPFAWPQQYQQMAGSSALPGGAYVPGIEQHSSGDKKLILQYYINATNFDPNWYKAWHRLATTYYNLVMSDRHTLRSPLLPAAISPAALPSTPAEHYPPFAPLYQANVPILPVSPVQSPLKSNQLLNVYAVNAVRCFFKAIQLAEGSRLDDTLRLLMLWFDYGDRPEVFEQLRESVKLVPLEIWLEVVPQLIGRLDSQQNTGLLVKELVIDVAKQYPQAWVYALTAATKSRNAQRSKVAKEILEIVAENKPILVEQAMLVNDELIRCAILWHELWHEALEDASRFYFQDKNVEEMMNVLRPLHQKIDQGHTTLKEQSFNQSYYKDLKDALEHCEAFRRTGSQKEMTAAWELYYSVFKRISNQLRQMNTLDLNYIAPRLCNTQKLELSIPGTYDPANALVTIASIHPHLQVIMSKQRPRKIYMRGSDGKEYAFLLKGHEDPRQDERVMQLFGLINSLILRETDTCRRNLTIQRYSITTLSQSSGLIGWVPNCDTLHALIKDYREKRKIPISEEHNKMQKLCIDIDKCTLLQKVEVFEEALRTTSGDDLRQTLWMKSPNSEIWFDRRTNYTRSMACMSMVGYILGLGDRHPSNLMLDRISGKIVHIDFGDCFEVAMKREKYPEKIPFRLTRMLVQAMEVTGIDGNYRLTCERTLRLLRNNNDSILAVLEAFVYDPVLNWRLTGGAALARRAQLVAHMNAPVGVGGTGVMPQPDEAVEADNWRPEEKLRQRNEAPLGANGNRGDNEAINRVRAKLCGRDFNPNAEISVKEQTNRLIEQATLNDNLCQCYVGWCPFW